MFGFLLRRILVMIPTFVGITIVAFLFIRMLPGDPVMLLAGERDLKPERYQELLHSSASTCRSGSST